MPRATPSKTIEKEEFTPGIGAAGAHAKCPLVGWTVAKTDISWRRARGPTGAVEAVECSQKKPMVPRLDVKMDACTRKSSG